MGEKRSKNRSKSTSRSGNQFRRGELGIFISVPPESTAPDANHRASPYTVPVHGQCALTVVIHSGGEYQTCRTTETASPWSPARRPASAESELENFDRVINFNLRGVFLYMKALPGIMTGQQSGSIFNMASVAGLPAYCASKGGAPDHPRHVHGYH
ncbi:MAG: SDR family NAD(P)-dependent oxidoreductase [Pseudomonadota bacterium]